MIEESFKMALRSRNWKYIDPVSKKTPDWLANKDVATGLQNTPQLYNLKDDPGELHDLAYKFPQKVKELKAVLTQLASGKTN